ncbi:hypothetical protein PV325_011659 [Microctonus aethiopoides]|nr:hypothetical protein PV325_011659 [Microctonus aethiopoides]
MKVYRVDDSGTSARPETVFGLHPWEWTVGIRLCISEETWRSNSNLSSVKENDIDDVDDSININNCEPSPTMTENAFSYSILCNSDKYNKTIVPRITPVENIPHNVIEEILAKNYDDFSSTELLEDFKTLSLYARLNSIEPSNVHSKLVNLLSNYVPTFSDDQLTDLLKYMELWHLIGLHSRKGVFKKLFSTIDETLLIRLNDLTVDQMLMNCDLIYHLKNFRNSKFLYKVMMKLGTKPKKLSAENYVHYMYLFTVTREPAINMYELEYSLESIVDKYSGDELGIIALAFFKTKTPIRNPALLDKMINKCICDMNHMGEIAISAIMKITRYSIKLNSMDLFRDLIRAFRPRINGVSAPSLVHAGHAAATVLIYEKKIINEIIERFIDHIPRARAKDLERILFVLVMYKYPKDSPQYELILKELRNPARSDEFTTFHKSYISSLMYLSHAGIYPLDIIDRVMQPDYLRDMYKNNSYRVGHPYLFIENSLQIEAPEYKGPTLPPKMRNYLVKKYSALLFKSDNEDVQIQSHQKFTSEVILCSRELLGSDKLFIDQLLPHYQRADIVLCMDDENNFVPPQQFITELPVGTIKYPPKVPRGYKWISLVLASQNHIYRNTIIPCGTFNSKLRQLEKIGYTPVTLIWSLWQKSKTVEAKKKYIHDLLLKQHTYGSN